MHSKNRETAQKIEFRLRQHEELFAQLLAQSARDAGRSIGDQARELVKTALTKDEQLQHFLASVERELAQVTTKLTAVVKLNEGLRTVHENLYQVRDDLVTIAVKVLQDAGRLQAEAATSWVKKALNTD